MIPGVGEGEGTLYRYGYADIRSLFFFSFQSVWNGVKIWEEIQMFLSGKGLMSAWKGGGNVP